jgi:hypothetical protein
MKAGRERIKQKVARLARNASGATFEGLWLAFNDTAARSRTISSPNERVGRRLRGR